MLLTAAVICDFRGKSILFRDRSHSGNGISVWVFTWDLVRLPKDSSVCLCVSRRLAFTGAQWPKLLLWNKWEEAAHPTTKCPHTARHAWFPRKLINNVLDKCLPENYLTNENTENSMTHINQSGVAFIVKQVPQWKTLKTHLTRRCRRTIVYYRHASLFHILWGERD